MCVLSENAASFNLRIVKPYGIISLEVVPMLFKRTIYDKFLSWKKETNGKKALLVEEIGRASCRERV